MTRKLRRRPIHYSSLSYADGASYGVGPIRKPYRTSQRKNEKTDPDGVDVEYLETIDDFAKLPHASRRSITEVLANRLNTRRAIRELVLPELEAIQKSLSEIIKRLDRMEQSSDQNSS